MLETLAVDRIRNSGAKAVVEAESVAEAEARVKPMSREARTHTARRQEL